MNEFPVYFEDKTIVFTYNPPDGSCVYDAGASDDFGIAKMLEKIGNCKRLFVRTNDPLKAFRVFLSQFVQVDAAGGLVFNERDELLMIHRNGRWDLPKGHVEPNETPCETAVREVHEETGVSAPVCGPLFTVTYHFYELHGKLRMKRTWWFEMSARGSDTIPQTEEGITEAGWIPRQEIESCSRTSFTSIREVLRKMK